MLPKMINIKQKVKGSALPSIDDAVKGELTRIGFEQIIRPGMRVGITVGSRGIMQLAPVLTTLIHEIKSKEGYAELIAAMGSHGNATKDGRLKLLESLGISAELLGVPICADYEPISLGLLAEKSLNIIINKHVLSYDLVILLNRIKPHTSYIGEIESGLVKMAAVGLGGHEGAKSLHNLGVEHLGQMVMKAGEFIINKITNVIGIGIVENSYEEIHEIKAMKREHIVTEEKKLLPKAKMLAPSLPVDKLDLLIVDEIGKNYSGTGMDCKVIGRFRTPGIDEPESPQIKRIVVFDLANASHGNANGIGLADFTTKRLVDKINYEATYLNAITSTFLSRAMLPLILPTEQDAVNWAVNSLGYPEGKIIRAARIKNTLHLDKLWVSESLLSELAQQQIELLSSPMEMKFNSEN